MCAFCVFFSLNGCYLSNTSNAAKSCRLSIGIPSAMTGFYLSLKTCALTLDNSAKYSLNVDKFTEDLSLGKKVNHTRKTPHQDTPLRKLVRVMVTCGIFGLVRCFGLSLGYFFSKGFFYKIFPDTLRSCVVDEIYAGFRDDFIGRTTTRFNAGRRCYLLRLSDSFPLTLPWSKAAATRYVVIELISPYDCHRTMTSSREPCTGWHTLLVTRTDANEQAICLRLLRLRCIR